MIISSDDIASTEQITYTPYIGLPLIPRSNSEALAAINSMSRLIEEKVALNSGGVLTGTYVLDVATFNSITSASADISTLVSSDASILTLEVTGDTVLQNVISNDATMSSITSSHVSTDTLTTALFTTTGPATLDSVVVTNSLTSGSLVTGQLTSSSLNVVDCTVTTLISSNLSSPEASIASLTSVDASIGSLTVTTELDVSTLTTLAVSSTSITCDSLVSNTDLTWVSATGGSLALTSLQVDSIQLGDGSGNDGFRQEFIQYISAYPAGATTTVHTFSGTFDPHEVIIYIRFTDIVSTTRLDGHVTCRLTPEGVMYTVLSEGTLGITPLEGVVNTNLFTLALDGNTVTLIGLGELDYTKSRPFVVTAKYIKYSTLGI